MGVAFVWQNKQSEINKKATESLGKLFQQEPYMLGLRDSTEWRDVTGPLKAGCKLALCFLKRER